MKNNDFDTDILADGELFNTASSELLTLGEGQVAYAKPIKQSDLAELSLDVDFKEAWGIFSATGETLALCDSPNAVWSFFADHELDAVALH